MSSIENKKRGVMNNPNLSKQVCDLAISYLETGKNEWIKTDIDARLQILNEIKIGIMQGAEKWVAVAAKEKKIGLHSPLVGEEWLSGPYALLEACNGLIVTLQQMKHKAFLNDLPKRKTLTDQLAVTVLPNTIWDKLLLSGISAEVWMQKGVNSSNLAEHTASSYDRAINERVGKIALVLGAGNIASISALDCLHKLFIEHQVVLLKMNPLNDYLIPHLQIALKPLLDCNALQIVKGDGEIGAYLTQHPKIDELHITGSKETHDAIIWGTGAAAKKAKKNNKPINKRRITSELGAVCPTIVVPGPWTKTDIRFQAEHIASQKLHNSGFNCVASQALILPATWNKTEALMHEVTDVFAKSKRPTYYPGANDRLDRFADDAVDLIRIKRDDCSDVLLADITGQKMNAYQKTEVFAPALIVQKISNTSPTQYLKNAIEFANNQLNGTLGANIIIHPATIKKIGKEQFEELISKLEYGCIGINAWTGVGFGLAQVPWGAFPGHTFKDVQSGIGSVHNTFMFDKPERTIVKAPFRPFPRSFMSGEFSLMTRPPWFITHKRQDKLAELMLKFRYKPSWLKLPRIFLNALLG